MIKPQTSSTVLLSLLLLFASLSLHPEDEILNLINTPDSEPPNSRRNYIVRFVDYKYAEDHWTYLRTNVKSGGWDWIVRRNPAARFTTDFGVVSIDESSKNMVIGEIESLSRVKDVSVDVSYARSLFEDKLERESGFCETKKRRGKMFTRMSFDEKDERGGAEGYSSSLSNQTVSWRRHLMGEVSS